MINEKVFLLQKANKDIFLYSLLLREKGDRDSGG